MDLCTNFPNIVSPEKTTRSERENVDKQSRKTRVIHILGITVWKTIRVIHQMGITEWITWGLPLHIRRFPHFRFAEVNSR
ncbi:MAG TPA: hypothetical protein DEW10_06055 [Bifidobacterium sp.]|nr:hypothetical protein [Bifidobacterium sp.]HAK72241.1 hypothetical protein [Bifidobacterium sp.]HCA73812.1 hypothetical protein [Bifidobacterium sp.]HCH22277.1 hypothetical protein [Bifidobacterium sp.]